MNDLNSKVVRAVVIYNDIMRLHTQTFVTVSQLTNDSGIKEIIAETMERSSSMINGVLDIMAEVDAALKIEHDVYASEVERLKGVIKRYEATNSQSDRD